MTIPRKTLEVATFWDQGVCLDCEIIQPPQEGEEQAWPPCCSCASDNVILASAVLAIAALIDEDEA